MVKVFVSRLTPRIQYAFDVVFGSIYKLKVQFFQDAEKFDKEEGVKINYSKTKKENSFHIKPKGLLSERDIVSQKIIVEVQNEIPIFFTQKETDFPFDVFAASFYLVSRYEEYLPHKTDDLGRFDYKSSLAFQNNFLSKPVVNFWAKWLVESLQKQFPKFSIQTPKFQFVPTIDVDNAYAYKGKGFVRTAGAFARSIFERNWQDIRLRSKVIAGKQEDPYDVFEKIIDIEKKYKLNQILFFLLADYDVNDKNVPPGNRKFQELIKHVNDYVEVGIHPSFASNQNNQKLKIEVERLTQITHRNVTKSRQHFLVVQFPNTYRNLIEEGITDDYSMGYPQIIGFRASIANSFNFYDLELEKSSSLCIHPFYAMEATCKYYQNQNPEEAIKSFKIIIDEVKNVGGEFYLLWHSDTLSGFGQWQGWENLYEELIKIANSN